MSEFDWGLPRVKEETGTRARLWAWLVTPARQPVSLACWGHMEVSEAVNGVHKMARCWTRLTFRAGIKSTCPCRTG